MNVTYSMTLLKIARLLESCAFNPIDELFTINSVIFERYLVEQRLVLISNGNEE